MSTHPGTDMRHRRTTPAVHAGAALLLAALLSGCAGSAPSNFYTLSTSRSEVAATSRPAAVVVAVGPVTLPDYLDRSPIVTRDSAYAISLADNDYWAGPLTTMVPRVLAQDVALRLPADRVVTFPQVGGGGFDYRMAVDVGQFDVDADGTATLAARWQIYAPGAPRALLLGDETIRRPTGGGGYEAGTAALSATLGDLSDRLVQGLNAIRDTAPRPLAD